MTDDIAAKIEALLDEAENAATLAARPWLQARAFANLASHAAALGDGPRFSRYLDYAERGIRRLSPFDRSTIILTLIRACTKANMPEKATSLAESADIDARRIRTPWKRRISLETCFRSYLIIGDLDRARDILEFQEKYVDGDYQMSDLAIAMVKIGRIAEAEKLGRSIGDSGCRSLALRKVAIAHICDGNAEACHAAIEAITELGWKAIALGELAEHMGTLFTATASKA
ncbi:hypothetical protein [Telmatospirillum siberiense]|nr:hypothetical protein [Telmatospirillum siberiense]